MAVCKQKSEFYTAANTLLEVARRHNELFVVVAVKLLITKPKDDYLYVVPLVWKRLLSYLRGADVCFFDKDKFLIGLSDTATQEDVRQFCERMINLLADEYYSIDKSYTIKVKLGISVYPNDAHDISDMIDHAKYALETINSQSNRLQFYQ